MRYEFRTGPEAVHDVLGVGFMFLGPSDCVPGQTQQERQFGRHEELQLGQYVENRLSTHPGRNLQHETVDAPESHTVRHVFLGRQSAVRGVPPYGLRVMPRSVTKPFLGRIARNGYSVHTQRCSARTRVHTQQRSHTQVSSRVTVS